jgi:hypothetical protein
MHGMRAICVTLLTDGYRTAPQNACIGKRPAELSTALLMNMRQLIIGTALGFFVAQVALYGFKRLVGWLQRAEVHQHFRKLTPSRETDLIGGFIRHAGLVAAGAAIITLGVWTVRDYLVARSARSAAIASTFDPAPAASDPAEARVVTDEAATPAPATALDASATPADDVDPYADPDFQVRHRPRHAVSLKETLIQRSEARARSDLLSETQQHLHRSQYDCEAADRASKYIKDGLDVWGFASWQVKYFPVVGYQGATLPQCKDIQNVIDPSWTNLQSAVAQASRP